MACCALAAFLVSQLFVLADWLRERLGMDAAVIAHSASAAWRLGDAPLAQAGSALPRVLTRRVGLAFAGGSLAFVLSWSVLGSSAPEHPPAWQIPYLCTSDPAPLLP